MRRKLRAAIAWLFVFGMLCIGVSAQAAITSLVATPGMQHIATGTATSFTVTWSVTSNLNSPLQSTSGRFGTPDITFATVNTLLSRQATAGSTVSFTETVVVPASVAVAAQQNGLSSITYSRDFVDDDTIATTGSVTIYFTSALGAAFGISREALSFDDGSPVKIAQVKDSLHARAQLTVTGTGLLQATWEVASPPSTQGEPFYMPLAQVQKHMSAGETQVLQSPSLPTNLPGLYLVRLRITNPLTSFTAPVIRYFIGEGRPGHGLPPAPISLLRPANLALLGSDTQFIWSEVKDARIYQLEIYTAPNHNLPTLPAIGDNEQGPPAAEVNAALQQRPLTGVLIPAKDTHTALSATVRMHLSSGQTYYWRLLAIDDSGVIIGRSPVRELRLP